MSRTPLSRHARRAAGWLLALALAALTPVAAWGQPCVAPIAVTPAGPLGTPSPPFRSADHPRLHSSTHLQGLPSTEKWAGGLLYAPHASTGFNGFTSAVVVNNPDPSLPAVVRIEYFDHTGAIVGTLTTTIAPEGHFIDTPVGLRSISPTTGPQGVGSARVTVLSGPGIVGVKLHHTRCAGQSCDQEDADQGLTAIPGASSMEQLQVVQDSATRLFWGPLPISTVDPVDFMNGQVPFFWVVNPNPVSNTVQVNLTAFDRTTGTVIGPILWRTIALPPFGTLLEKSGPHVPGTGVFEFLLGLYGTLVNPDLDVMVDVTSLSGLPILGDGIMMDGTSDAQSLRMASHMLASNPTSHLIDPDLSTEAGGIIRTLLGLYNPGPAAAGPITLRYFDRAGTLVSTGTIPGLLPNQSVRIPPGVFGNPANTGYGWVDIQGCSGADRLVGWTVREIVTPSSSSRVPQYHKAFGEILDGNGGSEPGPGFFVTNPSGTFLRKSAPFLRTASPLSSWPGYMTFANTTVPNAGPHFFRFFAANGADCTDFSLQPFSGVPWAATSTTLEDPQSLCSANQSGRADVITGPVNGIVVLGNRLYDYVIPGLAGRPPVYAGPADVVPTFHMPRYPIADEDEEEEKPVGPEGEDGAGG